MCHVFMHGARTHIWCQEVLIGKEEACHECEGAADPSSFPKRKWVRERYLHRIASWQRVEEIMTIMMSNGSSQLQSQYISYRTFIYF